MGIGNHKGPKIGVELKKVERVIGVSRGTGVDVNVPEGLGLETRSESDSVRGRLTTRPESIRRLR